jgi:transposase-like protein
MERQKIILRYSEAFKQKVVFEIENGILTVSEAQKLYDIRGGQTIQKWIEKLGKTHLLNKVIHIKMREETDKIKELEKQNRELESALAQAHLKIITLESTVKVLEGKSGVELKKKTSTELSSGVSMTKDSLRGNTK